MKKFLTGLFAGLLIGLMLATASMAIAGQAIKLIVNGQEVVCDVAPQNINGRILVPARYVAESLGASVNWDAANNAVIIAAQPTVSVNSAIKETTFEGLKAIEINEIAYFNKKQYEDLYYEKLTKDPILNTWYENIFIDSQNYTIYKGETYIKSSLYKRL